LLQHVDQHMRHEDVVSRIMLAQLARTLTEWHCNSFTDLIDEMELWDWNVTNKDFWSRLAKSLHSPKVSITWAEKMDQNLALVLVSEKMSWATGNGNAVHPQVQDTDWVDWGIAHRHWANCLGSWCTSLESFVDRWRGYEERHTDLKKGRVWKRRRSIEDSRRL